ncbi:hypothetical protein ACQY0O_004210 [Thecaphora frezii]
MYGDGGDDPSLERTALPLSDTNALLRSAANADKQQALIAHLYPIRSADASDHLPDLLAHLSTLRSKLDAYIQQYAYHDERIGGPYIWHREPPSLSLCLPASTSHRASSAPYPPSVRVHLRTGGDCVEDEWFLTYILHRATTDAAHFGVDLALTLQDEDGQFLLIEAAEALPKWVTPENVQNRVWIYRGHLHIVPLEHRSSVMPPAQPDSDDDPDCPPTITVHDALRAVADTSTFTSVSDDVERAAFARIQEYPLAAADHHHTTLAYLSRRVARVLRSDSQLVSNATEALTTRDVVSSRAAMKLRRFPSSAADATTATSSAATDAMDQDDPTDPGSSSRGANGDDPAVVLTPVRLTRHLYAHLCYDRFFPPKAFGKEWQMAVEKYRLRMHQSANGTAQQPVAGRPEDEAEVQHEMQQGRWRDIGAKIWCGLEMAYEESASRRSREKRRTMDHAAGAAAASSFTSDASAAPELSGEDYARFLASLRKLGYFGEEIEGSARWKALEAEAVSQWAKLKATSQRRTDQDDVEAQSLRQQVADKVDALLSRPTGPTDDRLTIVSPDAPAAVLASHEDSEDWMVVTTSDLDAMFESRFSGASAKASSTQTAAAFGESAQVSEEDKALDKLKRFTSKMDEFMKTQSDERGAAFLDELDDDEKQDWDDDELMLDDGNADEGEEEEDDEDELVRKEVEKRMRNLDEGERAQRLGKILPGLAGIWASSAGPTLSHPQPPAAATDRINKNAEIPAAPAQAASKSLAATLDGLSSTHTLHVPLSSTAVARGASGAGAAEAAASQRLASQQMRATSTLLRPTHYDGASDSDSELEQESRPHVRQQLADEYELARDDVRVTTNDDDEAWLREQDQTNVVEEEGEEEFLEFVRTTLGLSREQYDRVLQQRKQEGRYVPSTIAASTSQPAAPAPPTPASAPLVGDESITTFDEAMTRIEGHIASLSSSHHPAPPRSAAASERSAETILDETLLHSLLETHSPSDLPRSLLPLLPPELQEQLRDPAGHSGDRANLIRNFLKSQNHGAAAVLAARLGVGVLPPDEER